jgi:hypothetical protein
MAAARCSIVNDLLFAGVTVFDDEFEWGDAEARSNLRRHRTFFRPAESLVISSR